MEYLTLIFAFLSALFAGIVVMVYLPSILRVYVRPIREGKMLCFSISHGCPKPLDLTITFPSYSVLQVPPNELFLDGVSTSAFKDSFEVDGLSQGRKEFKFLLSPTHPNELTICVNLRYKKYKLMIAKAKIQLTTQVINKLNS